IGSMLHSTKKVKKGLGTIRQDLNVSIEEGNRVEIKGVQSLSSISRVCEKEVFRQIDLNKIKKILNERIKLDDLEDINFKDITSVFKDTESKLVKKFLKKKDCRVLGCILPGFKDLLKRKHSRLGKEMASYAGMEAGLDGIVHSDELPGFGINQDEIEAITRKLNVDLDGQDAFVFALGPRDKVQRGLKAVLRRARLALQEGVVEEVRKADSDDSTVFMRPMPGAARMYPETDVPPIRVTEEYVSRIEENLPELLEDKKRRFKKSYNLNSEQVKQIINSGYEDDFEVLVEKYPDLKNEILRTFLNIFPELEKEDVDIGSIDLSMLEDVFSGLKKESFAKEALSEIFSCMIDKDCSVDKAVEICGVSSVDEEKVRKIVKDAVSDRKDFVEEKKMDAIGPLMGVIMKKLRGKADGKMVSEILREEIKKFLDS
ncbi:MAG: Glu-tRNA(Gln) amidotransferase subunit GatE, partial [Candidatus Thermoplasmatota archaeon]